MIWLTTDVNGKYLINDATSDNYSDTITDGQCIELTRHTRIMTIPLLKSVFSPSHHHWLPCISLLSRPAGLVVTGTHRAGVPAGCWCISPDSRSSPVFVLLRCTVYQDRTWYLLGWFLSHLDVGASAQNGLSSPVRYIYIYIWDADGLKNTSSK